MVHSILFYFTAKQRSCLNMASKIGKFIPNRTLLGHRRWRSLSREPSATNATGTIHVLISKEHETDLFLWRVYIHMPTNAHGVNNKNNPTSVALCVIEKKEEIVLFNDALNTFYLQFGKGPLR